MPGRLIRRVARFAAPGTLQVGDITKTTGVSVEGAHPAKVEPINTLDWGKTILVKQRS